MVLEHVLCKINSNQERCTELCGVLAAFFEEKLLVLVMSFIFIYLFCIVDFIHCSFRRAVISDKGTDKGVPCSRGILEAKPNHSAAFS